MEHCLKTICAPVPWIAVVELDAQQSTGRYRSRNRYHGIPSFHLRMGLKVERMGSMIDTIDYGILKCLHDTDTPLWKKRIYQELDDRHAVLPFDDQVSLQTVGRRVDNMHEEGYLENRIVSPQDVPRDLIIGYMPTDAGVTAMRAKQNDLLRQAVRDEVFDDVERPEMSRTVLAEMISNALGISDHTDTVVDRYDRNELLALTGSYFLQQQIPSTAKEKEETRQTFRDAIQQRKSPSKLLP